MINRQLLDQMDDTLDVADGGGEGRSHGGLGLGQGDAGVRRLQRLAVVGSVTTHTHTVPAISSHIHTLLCWCLSLIM